MDSWKRKLKFGMVGGGQGAFIGGVHRIAASMDQQAELVAGCFSRDYENTRLTGEQLYIEPNRCYENYEQMAEREASLPADRRIDFVTIVTPNVSHYPIAKAFLESGIHVVCDKPMTYTLDEAKQLVELVERTGLVFALTHNYTGHPLVKHARELCRTDQIGVVRKALVEYLQDGMMKPLEKQGKKQTMWRVDPGQSGIGGALGDIGTHSMNLLEYVTGDPIEEVCADLSTFLPDRELDEDANVLLRFKGGGKGSLTISQIATGEENNLSLRVYGSEGALLWRQENPDSLSIYRYGEPRQTLSRGRREYLSSGATANTRIPKGHPEGYLEAFANIYRGAITAIRNYIDGNQEQSGEYDYPTAYDGLRGMQFIYAAVQSARSGSQWVALDSV